MLRTGLRPDVRLLLLTLVVAALLVAPVAQAHANFVASHPSPGARLASPPRHVQVIVSQDVDPAGSSLFVRDGQGVRVDLDDLHVEDSDPPRMTVTLRQDLADGVYRVEWKALSRVDHHTTQESFGFAVGNESVSLTTEAESNAPHPWALLARIVFFTGFFLVAAGLLFAAWVSPATAAASWLRVQRSGAWLLLLGCALLLLVTSVRSEIGPTQWRGSEVLRQLLGRLLLAGLLLALVHSPLRDRRRNYAMAATLLTIGFFSALSGHASELGPTLLLVDTLHLAATAAWVGGLALFAYVLFFNRALGATSGLLREIGSRFSRAALLSVVTMAVTGIVLAIAILGWPRRADLFLWFEGPYGVALLGKILLAAGMVVVAGFNRFLFLGRLGSDQAVAVGGEQRRFGRFVIAEASLGVVVLVLAAVMTASSPPHDRPTPVVVDVQGGGEEFDVRMVSEHAPQAGTYVDLRFQITWKQDGSILQEDSCGRPRGCILLEVVAPSAAHDEDPDDVHEGGEHRVLEPMGDGWWIVRDVLLVEPGSYGFLVEIQTEYVFLDVVRLELDVAAADEHAEH